MLKLTVLRTKHLKKVVGRNTATFIWTDPVLRGMSKGERVDRIQNELWTENELLRRLPEINEIQDDELRRSVIRTFMRGCPEYFWERPSSSTGKYHSPDERGKYGCWLHTKRVFAEYCNISESWVELSAITPKQREQGMAAALIHDMMKYGWPSAQNEHTVNNHDVIAAEVAMHIGEMDDDVVRLIATHMGSWGDGPEPHTRNGILLHTADKSAAREHNDIGVYYPAEELLEEWPGILVEEVEEDDSI